MEVEVTVAAFWTSVLVTTTVTVSLTMSVWLAVTVVVLVNSSVSVEAVSVRSLVNQAVWTALSTTVTVSVWVL